MYYLNRGWCAGLEPFLVKVFNIIYFCVLFGSFYAPPLKLPHLYGTETCKMP